MNSVNIEDLKLLRHNSQRIDVPDAPSYPYKLTVNLSPPELMMVTFVMLHGGSEVLVVAGKTRAAIDRFVEQNALRKHPRLRWLTIEGPDGQKEEFRRE